MLFSSRPTKPCWDWGILHVQACRHMQIILVIDLQAWKPYGGAYRSMCRPTNLAEAHTDVYLSGPMETYSEQGKDMSRTTFPAFKQAYYSRVGLPNNTEVRVYHMYRPTGIYEPGWDHHRAVGPQNLQSHILTHAQVGPQRQTVSM